MHPFSPFPSSLPCDRRAARTLYRNRSNALSQSIVREAARNFSPNRRIASDTMHSLQSTRKIDDPQSFYEANLETVHAIVDRHCRQRGIEKEEWDAIKAELHLLWSENGFKRLRNFRGENSCCRLSYLKTIVASTVIDIVRKAGGDRVRKSQRIARLGLAAELLRKLLYECRMPFEEACRHIREEGSIVPRPSRRELERLALELEKHGKGRRKVDFVQSEIALANASGGDRPEEVLEKKRLTRKMERVVRIMRDYAEGLSEEEYAIVQLRFLEETAISKIARMLGKKRAQVDAILKRILAELESLLKEAGYGRGEVEELFGQMGGLQTETSL